MKYEVNYAKCFLVLKRFERGRDWNLCLTATVHFSMLFRKILVPFILLVTSIDCLGQSDSVEATNKKLYSISITFNPYLRRRTMQTEGAAFYGFDLHKTSIGAKLTGGRRYRVNDTPPNYFREAVGIEVGCLINKKKQVTISAGYYKRNYTSQRDLGDIRGCSEATAENNFYAIVEYPFRKTSVSILHPYFGPTLNCNFVKYDAGVYYKNDLAGIGAVGTEYKINSKSKQFFIGGLLGIKENIGKFVYLDIGFTVGVFALSEITYSTSTRTNVWPNSHSVENVSGNTWYLSTPGFLFDNGQLFNTFYLKFGIRI